MNERGLVSLEQLLTDEELIEQTSFLTTIRIAMSACKLFQTRNAVRRYLVSLHEDKCAVRLESGEITLSGGADELATSIIQYVSPHILRDEKSDGYRDSLYTLAVLLFRLFTLSFPYEGARWLRVKNDAQAVEFYRNGQEFIFGPDTEGNRPQLESQSRAICYWFVYPSYLKNKFIRVFDNNERISEAEWLGALTELYRDVTLCEHCSAEIFYRKGEREECWRCSAHCRQLQLELTENGLLKKTLLLSPDLCFRDERCAFEIVVKNNGCWGIKNSGETVWKWLRPNGNWAEVERDQAVPLAAGLLIKLKNNLKLALTPLREKPNGAETAGREN